MDLSTLIATYAMQYVSVTPVVFLCAKAITIFTPTKLNTKKDEWYITVANTALRALNIVALNVLKDKNADDK